MLLVDLDEHYLTVESLRPGIELLPCIRASPQVVPIGSLRR